MKTLFTYLLLLASTSLCLDQQIDLSGQVSILNSQYQTGKIKYVEGAAIQAAFAGETRSGTNGQFGLIFSGLAKGSLVDLTVEKAGLEVVNEPDLLHVVLGRQQPLQVFLAPKGELARRQTEFYNVSLAALTANADAYIARLRADGEESTHAMEELEAQHKIQLAHRYEAEDLIREQLEKTKERLPAMAKRLAMVNLDFASSVYREAYEAYSRGDIQGALTRMNEESLAEKADAIVAAVTEIKQGKENFQRAIEGEQAKASQVYESYALKADAYELIFDYQNAAEVLQKGVAILEAVKEGEDLELADAYGALAAVKQDLGDYTEALKYQLKKVDIKEQILPSPSKGVADAYNGLASLYKDLGQYPKALEVQLQAIAVIDQVTGSDRSKITCYANLAGIQRLLGQYEEALETQEWSLEQLQKDATVNSKEIALCYTNIAAIKGDLGEFVSAIAYQQKALDIQLEELTPNHPSIATSRSNLANHYSENGAFKEALRQQLLAITIFEEILDPNHPKLGKVYNNLATIYHGLGEYEQAEIEIKRALKIRELVLASDHPDLAESYNNFAIIATAQDNLSAALAAQEKAISIYEKILGNHPTLATAYSNLGALHIEQGNYELAFTALQKGIAIAEKTLGTDHPSIATQYNNMAAVFKKLAQYDQALAAQLQALAIFERIYAPNHPNVGTAYHNLADIQAKRKRHDKALLAEQKAVAIFEQALPPYHPDLGTAYNNLALYSYISNDFELALMAQRKAKIIQERNLPFDHPDLANSYYTLARTSYSLQQVDSAIVYMNKCHDITKRNRSPDDPYLQDMRAQLASYYVKRAQKAMGQEQYQTVIDDLRSAITFGEEKGELYFYLGVAYYAQEDYVDAIESFDMSYDKGVMTDVSYSHFTGIAHAKLGHVEEARIRFILLQAATPGSAMVYQDWALFHILLEEQEIALDKLEEALQFDDFNWELLHAEKAFDPIRDHLRFQVLLAKAPTKND